MLPAATVTTLLEGPEIGMRPEPTVWVSDGRDCFIEGRVEGQTFLASLELDHGGAVVRRLCLRCPLVSTPASRLDRAPAVARSLLERYFRDLGAGEFELAGTCFSEDCLYAHPPYRPGEPSVEFHGRAQLLEGWRRRRGVKQVELEILTCVQDRGQAFIEGVANGGSFVSSVTLDHAGLIRRYVAVHTRVRVPRLREGS